MGLCYDVPRSQHRPIGVQMNAATAVKTVPFRRRFNLKKAKWDQYASYQLDAAMENIPATAECYEQFVNALRKVARKNIPHGCRRNYVPVSRFECVSGLSVYWSIIALGTRECGVAKLCRDPTVQSEFSLRVSLLKTFN